MARTINQEIPPSSMNMREDSASVYPRPKVKMGKLTSSSSQWIKKTKTDKVWLCESAGNLK